MRRIILGLVMLWAALFGACQASAQLMMTGAGRGAPSSGGESYAFESIQTGSAGGPGDITFGTPVGMGTGASRVMVLCWWCKIRRQ